MARGAESPVRRLPAGDWPPPILFWRGLCGRFVSCLLEGCELQELAGRSIKWGDAYIATRLTHENGIVGKIY